jgi:hypothetical protein
MPAFLFVAGRLREGMGGEPVLEDEDGGDLVNDLAAGGAGATGGVEVAMRFRGGEALIPEMNGKFEVVTELGGEGLDFGGLRTGVSGGIEREADDDLVEGAEAEQVREVAEVVAAAGAGEGIERLGGDAEGIGDGDADAAVADVETENGTENGAGWRSGVGFLGGRRHGEIVMTMEPAERLVKTA